VAGARFKIDVTAPKGSRIKDLLVAGEPLDPDRLYSVVSNNFLRGGGDGYAIFKDAQDAYDFGPDVADVLAEYLAQNTPYAAFTDGRIDLIVNE
jgi:5'-nucleotidase